MQGLLLSNDTASTLLFAGEKEVRVGLKGK